MADGKIVIDTELSNDGIKKDLQEVTSEVNKVGKSIVDGMNKAETSINKVGKSFKNIDVSKISSQMNKVSQSIEKTSQSIEKQQAKLAKLKTAFENATDVKTKDNISAQMQKTEANITKLETKLTNLNNKKLSLEGYKSSINDLDGEFSSASVSVTNSLDKIEKKAQETGKAVSSNLTNAGEKIQGIGNNISNVGNTLNRNVTLPIVGIGAAAIKTGMDFDSAMSRVKAISGATGEEFTKLHDQALQLGQDTAFSAKEAANGMENLASAGFSTNEIMSAMPGMLDLAASSGEDLANSADIAASTLRGFGFEADQAGHVADVLAKNAGATNAAVSDTGEAMKYVAPAAHAAGLGLEEVTAAIGIMSNSGIKGSQAGTTLRSALTRLASPAKEAADAMAAIGFKAFDSQGKMLPLKDMIDNLTKSLKGKTDQQKQDYIATIFGQEAMSGMLTLIDAGSSQLDDLTNSYKNADGAASDMAKTMQDNSKSSIEQMMGSLETAGIKIEEDFAPVIIELANDLQNLANAFAQLTPEQQEFYVKLALGAAAIGPVFKTVGTLTDGIGKLIKVGSKIGTLFAGAEVGEAALGGLSVAGGTAAAAVVALGAAIAGAVTYNELLGKSVDTSTDDLNLWEKLINDITGSTIKSKEELQKAGLVYKDFGEGVSDSFKEGIESATKSYHDFEMLLTDANADEKISDANSKKITDSINSMISGAKEAINSKKSELQNEFTEMFKLGDGQIDSDEQKVIDAVGSEMDGKLSKIDEIQGKISDIWTKAIQEHGKLSQEDVQQIENYLQQVQQIKAEVEAKNESESNFAKNEYAERLSGMSSEDAQKEYQDASKQLSERFANYRATYETGMQDLQEQIRKYNEEGNKEQAEQAQKELDAKDKEYDELIAKEKTRRREYLDMLYEKDPTLKNNFNEVDGTMFSTKDKDSQGRSQKLRDEFSELADVTKTGMVRIKKEVSDGNGGFKDEWHDVYVTFDQATGNITGEYDTFTGEYGGYSDKFEKQVKEHGDKIKAQMEELQKSLSFNGGGVKIDSDNNAINATTNQLITTFDTVVKKADGAKVAIQDINGTKIRLEFDKEGALTNAQDVEDAINGKLTDNPAVVKTKIEVDGQQVSTIDDTIEKLKKLPPETKTDITINGEEAQTTAEDAIKKLKEIPPDTNTDVIVSTDDANSKIDETTGKAENLDGEQPNVDVSAETGNADSNLENTEQKANEVDGLNPSVDVTANTGSAESGLSKIISDLEYIASHPVTAFVNYVKGGESNQYTGSTALKTGISYVNEHGWETANNNNVKMLSNGLAFLVGNHYSGGDGINDHMTSVNEMQKDVADAVNSRFSIVLSSLLNSLTSQTNILGQVATNTGDIKKNGDTAKTLIENLKNNTTGTFSNLQNEITAANTAKDKADNMKIEDNKWYSESKAKLDDVESQIDSIRDQIDETEDEATKKDLESQQKVLEKQKDSLDKEVDYYKDAAQKEIDTCKDNAEQQVKIAEEKKDKLTKLAEATTEAIKNQLEEEKAAAEKTINDELSALEKDYNDKVTELEQESTDNSRDEERQAAEDNINVLKTKMQNTASEADKRSYALQIQKAKDELNKKEDEWDLEDEKAQLEEEYNAKKQTYEDELKDTDAYYDKLLETDSINAQARYILLKGNNDELVALLQTYNPKWQDAGQELADSLLTGLNSQKQSIQDAVNEILEIKGETSSSDYYYNEKGQKVSYSTGQVLGGYVSGTSDNPYSGYYNVDEEGFEIADDSNSVAYVSQGAAIKNHMQSEQFIKSEISKQVAAMRASIEAEQANMQSLVLGAIANSSNSNSIIQNDNGVSLHVDNLHLNTGQDVEQLANELGVLLKRNRKY